MANVIKEESRSKVTTVGKDILKRYLAGGTWKSKKIDRKNKQSQTPGNKKNPDTCQATSKDRYMAGKGRSYKDREYISWCNKYDTINHVKKSG